MSMITFLSVLCGLFFSAQFVFAADSFEPGKRDALSGQIVGTGPEVKWVAQIGAPTYAAPVIENGKVLIGSLNNALIDPNRPGGRSVLICLEEETGKLMWQLPLPKNAHIPYFDSFCVGIASTPTIVENRAFLTTGRGEVLCLDLEGFANGNDPPFVDEAALYSFDASRPEILTEKDADIIWRFDIFKTLLSKPHDTNNCNIIYDDGLLYISTANAPNHTHQIVEHPEAPALIVLDAKTGQYLARDAFPIGNDISHGQWCSPTIGNVDGVKYIFYGAGNGVLYAIKAFQKEELLKQIALQNGKPVIMETCWTFHGDPRAQPGSIEKVPPFETRMGSPSYTCLPPPVFTENRIFMLFGHDAWNGARPFRSWLACIDANSKLPNKQKNEPTEQVKNEGTEDRTQTALVWGTPNIEGGAITPIVVEAGLLYFADRRGNFYCLETKTGKNIWTLPLKGDIWARPLLHEGKIYIGT
ncbi:MAG: PQQ-binding-like beta-propeller repeat protein, partial [Thermoguttaceae bacterium]